MSAVPRPIALPPAKHIGAVREFQSAEHDAALRLVWSRLTQGMQALFGWDRSALAREATLAEQRLQDQVAKAMSLLSGLSDRSTGDEALKSLFDEVRQKIEGSDVVCRPDGPCSDLANVEVKSRELAHELKEERQANTSRAHEEVVGYVDMEAQVVVPIGLRLQSSVPSLFVRDDTERSIWQDPLRLLQRQPELAGPIRELTVGAPMWSAVRERVTVWIDVRTRLCPVGQLTREVKVLQSLAGRGTRIVVVLADADAQAEEMLRSQGVWATTQAWWNELPTGE